jgi:TP901 family phage tail tape measure protein
MSIQNLQAQMGLDATQFVSGMQGAAAASGVHTQSLENLTAVSTKFNSSYQATGFTVKSVTSEVEKLTAKFGLLTKAQKELLAQGKPVPAHLPGTDFALRGGKITTDFTKQPPTPEAQANAFATTEKARQLFPAPTNATISQIAKYEQAISKIEKLITSGKISSGRAEEIFNAVKSRSGLTNLKLNGDEQKLVSVLGSISDGFKTAQAAGQKFHLGLKNVFQITEALLLKEAISSLVFQMQRAALEAVQFQIKISEIRTLSTENQASFASWSASIERVSNALGIPQIEVAKAAYEALSAQVTEGKEDTEAFILTAGKLARVGVSDIGESGKLLASVFNAYNISANRADEVSAKLFAAVDRGNFTVKDLAGNFGRVETTAAAVGVTFDELLAAMTTLTRQGVTASDAQTQLLNVFLKLQNPTQVTQKFLRNIGFETGPAAVQALGLVGVLEKIEKATRGDVAALTEFGGELRAVRGLIGLTTRGKGGEFQEDLGFITKGTREKFNQAAAIRGESAGDQLTIELTKVKNFFTNELGQSALNSVNDIVKAFGGLNTVVRTGTGVLLDLAKVWGIYFVATKVALGGQVAFNIALNVFNTKTGLESIAVLERNAKAAAFVGKTLTTIGVVVAAAFALDEIAKWRREMDGVNKNSEEYENTLKRIESLRKGKTETGQTVGHKLFTDTALDQSTQFSGFVDKLFQPLLQKEALAAQAANKYLDSVRDEGKQTALDLTEAFKRTGDSIESLIKHFHEGFRKADEAIHNSKKQVIGLKETVQSLIFDLKFEFADPMQKFVLRGQEIERLTEEADRLLASNSDEDIAKGNQLANELLRKVKEDAVERVKVEVEATRAERERQAKTTGVVDNTTIFAHTQQQQQRINQYAQHYVDLQEDVQKRKQQEKEDNDRLAKSEEDRLRKLQKRVELFNALKPFDESGKVKNEFVNPETGKFDAPKFAQEMEKRALAIKAIVKTEEEKALLLPQLEKARLNILKQTTAELEVQRVQTEQLRLGNIRQTSKEEFEQGTKRRIQASQATDLAGGQLAVSSEIIKKFLGQAASDTKFSTVGQNENPVTRTLLQTQQLVIELENFFRRQTGGREITLPTERNEVLERNKKSVETIANLQQELEAARQKLLERDAAGRLTSGPQDVQKLRDVSQKLIFELDSLIGKFTNQLDNSNFATSGGVSLGELSKQIKDAIELAVKARDQEVSAVRFQRGLEEQLAKIFTPAQIAAAKQFGATNNLYDATIRAASATENLVRELKGLSLLAAPAKPANIPVLPQGTGFGGDHHYGGLIKGPKGYDNLLIRAEAGEFVMSQEATRKWLPQLIEMNSGRSPKMAGKYHEGGLVQTNVGDVNVTITGPVSPERNVRLIGKQLRRAIQRGELDLSPKRR